MIKPKPPLTPMSKNLIVGLALLSSLFIATPFKTYADSCPSYNELADRIGWINTPMYNWNSATVTFVLSYTYADSALYNMYKDGYNGNVYCLKVKYGVNVDYIYSSYSMAAARWRINKNTNIV